MAEIQPHPIVFLPDSYAGLTDFLDDALGRTRLTHAEVILPTQQAQYFKYIGLSAIRAIGPPTLTLQLDPIEDDILWDNQKLGGKTTIAPYMVVAPTLVGFTSPTKYSEAISRLHARALTGKESPEVYKGALVDLLFNNENGEFDTKWAAYLPERYE